MQKDNNPDGRGPFARSKMISREALINWIFRWGRPVQDKRSGWGANFLVRPKRRNGLRGSTQIDFNQRFPGLKLKAFSGPIKKPLAVLIKAFSGTNKKPLAVLIKASSGPRCEPLACRSI